MHISILEIISNCSTGYRITIAKIDQSSPPPPPPSFLFIENEESNNAGRGRRE